MSATVSHSSVRHRRAHERIAEHSARRARTHSVSRHEVYLAHLRAERAARLRRARLERHADGREVRYERHRGYASHARMQRAAVTDRASGYHSFTRIHWVAPLRGSRTSLLRQNERDNEEGLTRIQDQAQLLELESEGKLVPIPESIGLRVNASLPADRRYCRPWTARFLTALARSHYARFHRPIEIDSAVRTVSFQRHLELINGNAAPAEGDLASPHLSGAAIDIGKKGMTFSEISWMRGWLLPVETAGKIDVEEEFHQACFHIDVYREYAPGPVRRRDTSAASLIAAGVN
jgi:Family of unknown function (DUF5715)